MSRPLNQIRSLRISLGLIVALGLGAARSEKVWAEVLNDLGGGDPRRVPQSGGMASRLLAGITIKHA